VADATMANRSKMTDLFTFNAVCLPIFASLLHPQQIREEPSALDADFRKLKRRLLAADTRQSP